uniref:AlNc14C264G9863 protein n=1 Tax=Albugo laibachii Nc14 TaxID=890382 RepID=F0WU40_9STRA|nr:AlNc14C264G9863 [Albugo laibachii Nc14]|eukprot:CCA24885.1 AlNc14C264G9863 [Albugo laibachii Nc14]
MTAISGSSAAAGLSPKKLARVHSRKATHIKVANKEVSILNEESKRSVEMHHYYGKVGSERVKWLPILLI